MIISVKEYDDFCNVKPLKTVEKIKPNSVLFGDCLEVMNSIEDKSIDMICCDLPYQITSCNWDSIIPFDLLWSHYERLIKKNGAIVLTASQPFSSKLVMSNIKNFKCEWIWEKNRGSNFATVKYQPFKEHENVLVFGYGRVNYYPIMENRKGSGLNRTKYIYNPSNTDKREGINNFKMVHANHNENNELRYPSSIQKFNCEVGYHPTQKPIALFEYLIKTYTNEGDLVLDNCAGSGTTGIAAINTKRNYILIEKEKKYYDIILKRIEERNE